MPNCLPKNCSQFIVPLVREKKIKPVLCKILEQFGRIMWTWIYWHSMLKSIKRKSQLKWRIWSYFGEGNGNPLQYSCLENPVDRGAWWAAVHRVAQSRTQLKRLSMHACVGEGNGNPLQYSCLENPRDRGDWWAVVYGVAQSWTQLKRLSSSSRYPRV